MMFPLSRCVGRRLRNQAVHKRELKGRRKGNERLSKRQNPFTDQNAGSHQQENATEVAGGG